MCRGPECGDQRSSRDVYAAFARAIGARDLTERVELGWQSCFGRCTQGPNVLVQALAEEASPRRFAFATMPLPRSGPSALYNHVSPTDADELVDQHLLQGKVVARLIEPPAFTRRSRPVEPPPAQPARTRRSDGDG